MPIPMNTRSIATVHNLIMKKLEFPVFLESTFEQLNPQLKFELCSDYYIGLITAEALMDQLCLEMARFTSLQREDMNTNIENMEYYVGILKNKEGWDRDFAPLIQNIKDKLALL